MSDLYKIELSENQIRALDNFIDKKTSGFLERHEYEAADAINYIIDQYKRIDTRRRKKAYKALNKLYKDGHLIDNYEENKYKL